MVDTGPFAAMELLLHRETHFTLFPGGGGFISPLEVSKERERVWVHVENDREDASVFRIPDTPQRW